MYTLTISDMALKISFLIVFGTELCTGLNVVYNVMTADCGRYDQVNMLRRSTPLRKYGLKMETKTSFVFDVKAANDVAIYATDTTHTTAASNCYRFYIGGLQNTKYNVDEIRNGQHNAHVPSSGSLLNVAVFKTFWFSWENGEIQVGQGQIIGQNTLIEWTDPNPIDVQGIGIGTCWAATGNWKFLVEVEEEFSGYFSNCQMSNTRSELPMIAYFVEDSAISCAAQCAANNKCIGFNFKLIDHRCEVLSSGDELVTSIMRNDLEGWKFYAKCFDRHMVCVGCFF